MGYLDEWQEAGRVFTAFTRCYAVVAVLIVGLSFFPSVDDEATVSNVGGAVAYYDSGNLWEIAAKGYDNGVGSALLTVVLVPCLLVAAFRKGLRMVGLDVAIAMLAALLAVLLLTRPDYLDTATPALLPAGQAAFVVLSVILGVVIGTFSHAQRRLATVTASAAREVGHR